MGVLIHYPTESRHDLRRYYGFQKIQRQERQKACQKTCSQAVVRRCHQPEHTDQINQQGTDNCRNRVSEPVIRFSSEKREKKPDQRKYKRLSPIGSHQIADAGSSADENRKSEDSQDQPHENN